MVSERNRLLRQSQNTIILLNLKENVMGKFFIGQTIFAMLEILCKFNIYFVYACIKQINMTKMWTYKCSLLEVGGEHLCVYIQIGLLSFVEC